MEKQIVSTTNAPAAVGPYSQAVRVGDMVFTAGQVAIDPETASFEHGDVAAQTDRVLRNLAAVLEAAGSSLPQVVKTSVFLTTMEHFAAMNEVYARYFAEGKPARSTVAVSELPLGALVEIDAVALVAGGSS